jgi:hypothetical protein
MHPHPICFYFAGRDDVILIAEKHETVFKQIAFKCAVSILSTVFLGIGTKFVRIPGYVVSPVQANFRALGKRRRAALNGRHPLYSRGFQRGRSTPRKRPGGRARKALCDILICL